MSNYAWILLASVGFPLILSFDRKVAFWRQWPRALAAALVVAPVFVVWDALATARGDWGFAPEQILGPKLAGLPLEELLFFILVPFCCVFIQECLDAWFPDRPLRPRRLPFLGVAGLAVLALALAWPRFYTATLLGFTAIFLILLAGPWRQTVASRNFWLTQAICLVPFVVVNGFLTGIPVVTYAPQAILGPRLLTIPIEDALYSFVLVGANQLVFRSLGRLFGGIGRPPVTPSRHRTGEPKKAVVIGAGLGGLAAAARLARLGWQVQVFEAAEAPGGKAGNLEQDGFRFDTGPSLLTLPGVFDELFSFCGERRSDHLDFVPLDDICHYFWPDGSRLRSTGAAGMPGRLAAAFGEDLGRVQAYFRKAAAIHRISAGPFLEHSLHEPASYLSPRGLRGILGLPRMSLFTTMHRLHGRYFKNPRSQQLMDRLATYNGSSPWRTPGTLAIIAHTEYGLGGHAVRQGIVAIPRQLEALARRQGVAISYGTPVRKIIHQRGRVRAVQAGGQEYPADVVLCNGDVSRVYQELLGNTADPLYRRQQDLEPSSSGVVFYWGMGASFPELGVNNIFFSPDYHQDFQAIFERQACPEDPTVYVNITSKVDPGDAPAGGENWFVLVNAPCDTGQDWAAETRRLRQVVIRNISRALGRDIAPLIRTEAVMTPPDIAAATGSWRGSLYGIASNSRTAAFLRHPNRHPAIGGLYFCGGSVHPGGGMPLVLLSARIATGLIQNYERYVP